MKKLWKWLALPAALLLCASCGMPYDPNRHQYTPEERSAHYEEYPYDQLLNACGFVIPDGRLLESTVLASDLILTGRVADDGVSEVVPVFEGMTDWSYDAVHDALIHLAEEQGLKNGRIMWPVRVAVSGKPTTPGGAVELCQILGKEETLRRIQQGIQQLTPQA